MPLAKLRQDYTPLPAQPQAAHIIAELDGIAAAQSPALALQEHLAYRTVAASTVAIEKWSLRRSLALIVASSAALWMAILMAGAEASRMIA